MRKEPEQTFFESRHSRMERLVSALYRALLISILVAILPMRILEQWQMFLVALCMFIVMSLVLVPRGSLRGSAREVARVGAKGLLIDISGERWVELKWSEVRSFEIPEERIFPEQGYVNFLGSDGRVESRDLPLALMDRPSRKAFIAAIRPYWPDISESWQSQLRQQEGGVDSGAG